MVDMIKILKQTLEAKKEGRRRRKGELEDAGTGIVEKSELDTTDENANRQRNKKSGFISQPTRGRGMDDNEANFNNRESPHQPQRSNRMMKLMELGRKRKAGAKSAGR